jgi:hypothetical protein
MHAILPNLPFPIFKHLTQSAEKPKSLFGSFSSSRLCLPGPLVLRSDVYTAELLGKVLVDLKFRGLTFRGRDGSRIEIMIYCEFANIIKRSGAVSHSLDDAKK